MLVVYGDGTLIDAHVRDLPNYLTPGDVLVFNDTKVLPAALSGVRRARDAAGADISATINLVEPCGPDMWAALARPGKRLRIGDRIDFADGFAATVSDKRENGQTVLRFNKSGEALAAALDEFGAMPLPPYIARRRAADASDRETYQTSFAVGDPTSVAAPTAGLHFTPRLLSNIDQAGLIRETVRLTVGLGTFAPLKDEHLESGRLHAEWRSIDAEAADRINQARTNGQNCIAIGTTSLRSLESAATSDGMVHPVSGETDIFLRPGYDFRACDGLVTNFHLPASSLFMLVSALMSTQIMQAAYAHAIANAYRFYSYGDACLLLPNRSGA